MRLTRGLRLLSLKPQAPQRELAIGGDLRLFGQVASSAGGWKRQAEGHGPRSPAHLSP